MRKALTVDGGEFAVQGFRWGGGINLPYVYCAIIDSEGNVAGEAKLGLGQANELSEFIRQEAEFAQGERKEEA